MRRWVAAAVVGVVAGLTVAATGSAIERAAAGGGRALGPGHVSVDVGIDHSRFSVERLRVRPGTVVRFVVTNDDPIAHELVVGDDDVHARHVAGTEAVHPPVPGEVSVAPGEVGVTVVRFEAPGTVRFACHLPGHLAYGMEGEVVVG
ncbi:MAG: hypothetical protein KY450_08155 [Actinobacteria bacterium]|nr:hypothetical protein [Actinomycetota bacterium]